MVPTVAEPIRDQVTLQVRCADRLYLNGYVPGLQRPGGVGAFLRQAGGLPIPSPAGLGQVTDAFTHRLRQWAEHQGLPWEQAVPDAELLALLDALGRRPETDLHLVSGGPRAFLERWFGALPLHLHAKQGGWSRRQGATGWESPIGFSLEWREILRPVLEDFAARTPGALVEVKELGLSWHWRAADEDVGSRHANELGLHLLHVAANLPVDVLVGDQVVELRPQGASKAGIGPRVFGELAPGAAVLAAGDDRTDEDMFAALPDSACTIHVGSRRSRARFSVPDVHALRRLLHGLLRRTG
jgi:trehalose 6-phosphate synthase/phosphatase